MTDRERLIDLLGEMQSIGIKESNVISHGYTVYVKDYVRNDVIADHFIANGVTVQRWIPASEPPKEK